MCDNCETATDCRCTGGDYLVRCGTEAGVHCAACNHDPVLQIDSFEGFDWDSLIKPNTPKSIRAEVIIKTLFARQ